MVQRSRNPVLPLTVLLLGLIAGSTGAATAGNQLSRPLSARGLDNLDALTQLLGYVRFFHPSDEAAVADWDELAIAAMGTVEGAASPAELAAVLEAAVRPIAPTVQVFVQGSPPELPAALVAPPGSRDPKVVAWRHHGVNLSGASEDQTYQSRRIDNQTVDRQGGGYLWLTMDAEPYFGRQLRLHAAAQAELDGEQSRAELVLQVFDNRMQPVVDARQAIGSTEWQEHELVAEVPEGVSHLMISLQLNGEGRVRIDDVSLLLVGKETGEDDEEVITSDFEAGYEDDAEALLGWGMAPESERAGYSSRRVSDDQWRGRHCAELFSLPREPAQLPPPAEVFRAKLAGGVACMVPVSLYADEQGTLPHAGSPQLPAPPQTELVRSGNDRATRLAVVALAWTVLQHFYPYFDVIDTDWHQVLRETLSAAAVDPDEQAFLHTLQRMVAALHDGHGRVRLGEWSMPYRTPLLWEWIEDQVVITHVVDAVADRLQPGDLVLAVNGQPIAQALADTEASVSAATPAARRLRALDEFACGARDEEVVLLVSRFGAGPDDEPVTVTVKRSHPRWGTGSVTEPRPDKVAELAPGIFYLDLDRITTQDYAQVEARLNRARGIIFDLRGYPRQVGLVALPQLTETPIASSQWCIPIVSRPDRQQIEYEVSDWTISPAEPRLTARVAYITNARALSAAETYLGFIEQHQLAEIVGAPTAGTNGNANRVSLPAGYSLSFTGLKVLKTDGSQHHGVGIIPTIPVTRTIAGVAAGRDELLERALAVVSEPAPGGSSQE